MNGEMTTSTSRARPLNVALPTGNDVVSARARVELLERLLERSFVVPGLNMPVGLDALVGLVPVLGEAVTAVMGAYLVWEARNIGLPKWKLARMSMNVLFDTAIGSIPIVGDAADFVFRSNTRNLRIIRRHLDRHHPQTQVIEG